MAQQQSEIRYLTPPSVDVKKKKYCRFKKAGIKYIDYKDPEFLKKFLKNPASPHYRNFTEISEKSCSSSEKSSSLGIASIRN